MQKLKRGRRLFYKYKRAIVLFLVNLSLAVLIFMVSPANMAIVFLFIFLVTLWCYLLLSIVIAKKPSLVISFFVFFLLVFQYLRILDFVNLVILTSFISSLLILGYQK